ncbi:MAG TPA: hypothetical protein ENJ18_07370 [Nannocystis exedens]|nr:hypothetical protein [Nannocystis exedens]
MALVAATARLLTPIDGLRRRWLLLLGPLCRPLMVNRDLRVATMASLMIVTATLAALLIPLWVLALGPMVWGVPHLLADLRYMVVGPGFHRRAKLWILGALPILATGFGADLSVGLFGVSAVAIVARTGVDRRLFALAIIALVAAAVIALGPLADLTFAYLHNFIAVALWWSWRRRERRLHWIPLALFIAASGLLLSPLGLALAESSASLFRDLGGIGIDDQLARLAPGIDLDLGLRLVLLFTFTQSIHYAVWVHLLPDEDRRRATPPTFRRSFLDLCRDLGGPLMLGAAALALLFAIWAILDLRDATLGYFRFARFHGHLELAALTLLVLERRLPWSQ